VRRIYRLVVIFWALFRQYRALRSFRRAPERRPDAPARFAKRQVLSTRPDLLPAPYVAALADLQERAPAVPFPIIQATVEDALASTLAERFATFEVEPTASASLSQVHRATLSDGTVVAVKVQRPKLEPLVRRDLDALSMGLRWLARIFPRRMRRSNLLEFFDELRRYTLLELDFVHEGTVIDRFRANFAGRSEVRIPRVHWSHTASRVLTLEWVEGMRVHEAAVRLDASTRSLLANRLVDVLLQMFVSDGLFHADLHPGNVFFHADGTFTLLDFGMYGELTPAQRDRFILYCFAVVQRQTRRAFHHFAAQTRALPGADEGRFRARFDALARDQLRARLPRDDEGGLRVWLPVPARAHAPREGADDGRGAPLRAGARCAVRTARSPVHRARVREPSRVDRPRHGSSVADPARAVAPRRAAADQCDRRDLGSHRDA